MNTLSPDAPSSVDEALEEVKLVLSVGSGRSPIPLRVQSRTVARTLANSEWIAKVLGRDVSLGETAALEHNLEQWAYRLLDKKLPSTKRRK